MTNKKKTKRFDSKRNPFIYTSGRLLNLNQISSIEWSNYHRCFEIHLSKNNSLKTAGIGPICDILEFLGYTNEEAKEIVKDMKE